MQIRGALSPVASQCTQAPARDGQVAMPGQVAAASWARLPAARSEAVWQPTATEDQQVPVGAPRGTRSRHRGTVVQAPL